jgi:Tat protein secretion system quality control protein TatD with DNase activity
LRPYELLKDAIDLHIHAGPDLFPRELDEAEVVHQAKEIGMRGVLLKSHFTTNADRVYMLKKRFKEIDIFSCIVLNKSVGGINPEAVFTAMNLGAKRVEMPTVDSEQHIQTLGRTYPWSKVQLPETEGIRILSPEGELIPGISEVAELVAQYDGILCTGHLTVPEMYALIEEAKDAGVEKILVTHADLDVVSVSKEDQKKMAGLGAYIEHSFTPCTHLRQRLDPRRIAEAIKYVGVKHCVMSSDMGQPVNPIPREGFRMFVKTMLHLGISESEIDVMIRENPAKLLGIDV